VLLTPEPLARSAGGLTLLLTARATWSGDAPRARVMSGLALDGRVISPRRRIDDRLSLTTRHAWASGVADAPPVDDPAGYGQAG
jgi:hypothetical protein